MTKENFYVEEHEASLASSKDIDNTILLLQSAFSDGRLDEKEFDKRIAQAVNIKTHTEIFQLVKDLSVPDKPARRLKKSIITFCGGIEQKGRFSVPSQLRIITVMGGCVIDLSQASFESVVTDIHVIAVMGGVEIVVPRGVRVEVDGTAVFGGFDQNIKEEDLPSHVPTLHIRGLAFMGGAEVRTKKPRT